MKNPELPQSCPLPNKVNVQLHVLGPVMMYRVVRMIYRKYIVAEDEARFVNENVNLQ
jgi:hypothetical protein